MRQRGATLVEAAIVLPILVFVLFGLVQFALMFTTEVTLMASATVFYSDVPQQVACQWTR